MEISLNITGETLKPCSPRTSTPIPSVGLFSQQQQQQMQTETPKQHHYQPLMEYLLHYYRCSLKDFQIHLTNLSMRRRIIYHLRSQHIYTTHLRPKNRNFRIHAQDISVQNANHLPAFNGKLGITVRQFFFTKHSKDLRHHYMPCIIEHGGRGHKSFYPFEVLTIKLN